jgi:pilus assembly protein FimV
MMCVSQLRKSCWILALLSLGWEEHVHATGLGAVNLHSGLGEPLQASVQLFGAGTDELDARCLKVRLESLEGATVITPIVSLEHTGTTALIRLSTRQAINEPALNAVVRVECGAQVRRDYQILLDPVPATNRVATSRIPPARLPAASDREEPAASPVTTQPKVAARRDSMSRLDSADAAPPAHARHHQPAATKAHPVLKLSATHFADDAGKGILQLRLADQLTPSIAVADHRNMVALQTASARPEAAPDEEQKRMQNLMKDLHAEAVALRAETARMKQQNLAYRNELDSTHGQSLNWLKVLAGLLAICFTAVGWLLWRVFAMKQATSQPWHAPFTVLRTEAPDNDASEAEAEADLPDAAEIDDDFDGAPATATAYPHAVGDTADGKTTAARHREVPAIDEFAAPARITSSLGARAAHKETAYASNGPEHIPKAEEILDVMELVDAWMTLNAPDKVLELLRPFQDVAQPESPRPWLCLLDVYRALGDQKKYEAILARIKTLFNVKLAPWDAPSAQEPLKTLPAFPHVVDKIAALWPTGELVPYLESLLHDDRDGTRNGFDLPAYRDLLQLVALARDPARLMQPDQALPDQVRTILFGTREQGLAYPFSPASREMKLAPLDTAPATEEKPRILERPRYITASYERAIAGRKTRKNHAARNTESLSDPGQLNAIAADDLSPIAIKLHLAIAYQDVGDKEGVSQLLDEVIQGGNETQAQQARRMLEKLA